MYKVSEVAKLVGVSTAAIYKELKRIDNKFITVDNGKKFITEEGFRYFQERYRQRNRYGLMMILCVLFLLKWRKRIVRSLSVISR